MTIEHALHNNRMKLFLKFDYDRETIELVKKMADAKWSNSQKSWYMSYYKEAISHIKNNLHIRQYCNRLSCLQNLELNI